MFFACPAMLPFRKCRTDPANEPVGQDNPRLEGIVGRLLRRWTCVGETLILGAAFSDRGPRL